MLFYNIRFNLFSFTSIHVIGVDARVIIAITIIGALIGWQSLLSQAILPMTVAARCVWCFAINIQCTCATTATTTTTNTFWFFVARTVHRTVAINVVVDHLGIFG